MISDKNFHFLFFLTSLNLIALFKNSLEKMIKKDFYSKLFMDLWKLKKIEDG